jgi:hypothetical protein
MPIQLLSPVNNRNWECEWCRAQYFNHFAAVACEEIHARNGREIARSVIEVPEDVTEVNFDE